jgi:hypothetical protein
MMKLVTAISLVFVGSALANSNDLSHRPPSFNTPSGKVVFVDFTSADYSITYNVQKKSASVVAEIAFNAPEAGMPIFDAVTAPTTMTLDGQVVYDTETKTPSNETTLRYVNKVVSQGSHKMTIEAPLTELVEYTSNGVKSAFWTSDLSERQFLERYLPANFEFDQVPMTISVKFIGASDQVIYTNGVQKVARDGSINITYPKYYTASSLYFHTTPKSEVKELRTTFKSIDGRELPVVVYSKASAWTNLESLKSKTAEVFQELERDYGAFPHPSITVYNSGMGGMEYCGATITAASALGHELFHSYFARGMMPANGNSGWLDEALASWRDDGYQRSTSLSGSSQMSAHPLYTRTTDRAAYSFGARFMSYLDGKMQDKGGLKLFLRHIIENRVFQPLFVEEFNKEMSEFYGRSVDEDFKRYTYGKESFEPSVKDLSDNSPHQKLTLQELKSLL